MAKNNFNQMEFVTIMNKDINRLEKCNPNSTSECIHMSDILTKVKELKIFYKALYKYYLNFL